MNQTGQPCIAGGSSQGNVCFLASAFVAQAICSGLKQCESGDQEVGRGGHRNAQSSNYFIYS